jgi:RHS repeat-associated protein
MTTKETYDGSTTETYTYFFTPGNELTKQTLSGTDTNFSYDGWGRMISKWVSGGSSASYYWNYGDKLTKVSSNFSGEGTVEYDYGGDAKRRERFSGGATTWYNYDRGWNLLNEENGSDTLTMTYVHDPVKPIGTVLADLAGTTPATGTARYYFQDNIGSTRRLRDASKGSLGQYEYEPYGNTYSVSGATITDKFTGHDWDALSALYYTPARFYSAHVARWISRDPTGFGDGPNLYLYVRSNPRNRVDAMGTMSFRDYVWVIKGLIDLCRARAEAIKDEEDGPNAEYGHYEGEPDDRNCMRHCVAICRLTSEIGKGCSFVVGWGNEIMPHGSHPFDHFDRRDLRANTAGRNCGGTNTTRDGCKQCCSRYCEGVPIPSPIAGPINRARSVIVRGIGFIQQRIDPLYWTRRWRLPI